MFALRWRLVGLLLVLLLPAQVGAAAPPGVNGPPATVGVAQAVVPIGVAGGWRNFSWGGAGERLDTEGPLTFTATGPVVLRVTDIFCTGDRFRLIDNGSTIGETSEPSGDPTCANTTTNPNVAYSQARYSSGCFPLEPGAHSIRVLIFVNPFNGGAASLRVDPGACTDPIPNFPPQVSISPIAFSPAEMVGFLLSGFVFDPDGDPLSALWTVQPGVGTDPGATCFTDFPTNPFTFFRCTDDGTFQLTLTVNDGRGGQASATVPVSITNLPPTIGGLTPLPGASVPSTVPTILTAQVADPGVNDTVASCRFTWGDGAVTTSPPQGSVCIGSHKYPAAGRYVARLQTGDDDGGLVSTTVPLNVGGASCAGGRVSAAVIGIDPVGGDAAVYAPTDLARTGTTGLFPGTRYSLPRAGAAAATYVARGETFVTGLYVANIDGAAHPGLALSVRYPKLALGLGSRVVAADGSTAYIETLGSQPLPRYLPNYFTVYDRNGELLIVNPPRDAAGNFIPLFLSTNVRPSAAGSIAVEAAIAGEIINSQLRGGLANVTGSQCGDKTIQSVAPFVGGPIGGAQPISELPFYPF